MKKIIIIFVCLFGLNASLAMSEPDALKSFIEKKIYQHLGDIEEIDVATDLTFYKPLNLVKRWMGLRKGVYHSTLLVFGGFNSCAPGPYGTSLYKRATQFRKGLQKKKRKNIRLIISCFGRLGRDAHIFTESKPKSLRTGDVDLVTAIAEAEIFRAEKPEVHIIGHSHGGWLAMKVASELDKKIKIKGLATIDPVSHKECKPNSMALGMYRQYVDKRGYEKGCTRSPKDINQKTRRYIAKRSNWWQNYFETNTFYLHSSAIKETSFNMLVSFNKKESDAFMAHAKIDDDQRVWDHLSETLMKDF